MKLRCAGALWVIAIVLPIAAFAGAVDHIPGGGARLAQSPASSAAHGVLPGQRCSAQYQSLLKLQIEALKRLKQLARGQGERLCAGIEAADQLDVNKLLDPRALEPLLSQRQRELLQSLGIDLARVDVAKFMRLLGIDAPRLDLRELKEKCRRSQGGLDRFASEELGRLEGEIMQCDDRV